MHERECKGYISFNRGVNEFNRGVNELNRGVNDLNRGVNHSVARQGCNLRAAVTSQGCCCGNIQIHPLDLGQLKQAYLIRKQCHCSLERNSCNSGNARATKVKSQVLYICIYIYPQFFIDTPDSTLVAPTCQLVSTQ